MLRTVPIFFSELQLNDTVNIADSTFGILINDVDDTDQTYEAVCHSRAPGGTARAYMSRWVSGGWFERTTLGTGTDHIRVNNVDKTIDLACDYDSTTLGFTYSDGNDIFAAVSGDDDHDHFGDDWETENVPSSDMEDITSTSAIPEFSTLLMPMASVILIVGYNHRLKRKYSQQH